MCALSITIVVCCAGVVGTHQCVATLLWPAAPVKWRIKLHEPATVLLWIWMILEYCDRTHICTHLCIKARHSSAPQSYLLASCRPQANACVSNVSWHGEIISGHLRTGRDGTGKEWSAITNRYEQPLAAGHSWPGLPLCRGASGPQETQWHMISRLSGRRNINKRKETEEQTVAKSRCCPPIVV